MVFCNFEHRSLQSGKKVRFSLFYCISFCFQCSTCVTICFVVRWQRETRRIRNGMLGLLSPREASLPYGYPKWIKFKYFDRLIGEIGTFRALWVRNHANKFRQRLAQIHAPKGHFFSIVMKYGCELATYVW